MYVSKLYNMYKYFYYNIYNFIFMNKFDNQFKILTFILLNKFKLLFLKLQKNKNNNRQTDFKSIRLN